MKNQFPLEMWMAILNWISRWSLAKKSAELWDSQLTPIVQHSLHQHRRNVRIRTLKIIKGPDNEAQLQRSKGLIVPFAEVEMPGNIVSFRKIEINYFDSTVLAFLYRMRPIFQNVRLDIFAPGVHYDTMQPILGHIMPLISGQIDLASIFCYFMRILHDNHAHDFFHIKWLYTKGIYDKYLPMLIDWLFSTLMDGQPRMFEAIIDRSEEEWIGKIRERFLAPNRETTCPFLARLNVCDNVEIEASINANDRTGEQLIVREVVHQNGENFVLVINCAIGVQQEWLAQREREILEWKRTRQRVLAIWHPQIGAIDTVEQLEAIVKSSK